MTVRLVGDLIRLEGECGVEEAETLLGLVQEDTQRVIDIGECRHLHGAVAQVLLGFGVKVVGAPHDTFLRAFVAPNFPRPNDGQV